MRLHELGPNPGARRKSKRLGRGTGSGKGKTAGRGTKGQGARSGGTKAPWFEGGQTPLSRRVPKRGFKNPFKKTYAVINVGDLARFAAGTTVTPELLEAENIVKGARRGLKVLGEGELPHALEIKAHAFSKAAVEKIEAVGGRAEVIAT